MQAALVYMVIAILQLQAGLLVDYFSFAEGTVSLGNVKVALRRRICFLESHGEPAW